MLTLCHVTSPPILSSARLSLCSTRTRLTPNPAMRTLGRYRIGPLVPETRSNAECRVVVRTANKEKVVSQGGGYRATGKPHGRGATPTTPAAPELYGPEGRVVKFGLRTEQSQLLTRIRPQRGEMDVAFYGTGENVRVEDGLGMAPMRQPAQPSHCLDRIEASHKLRRRHVSLPGEVIPFQESKQLGPAVPVALKDRV